MACYVCITIVSSIIQFHAQNIGNSIQQVKGLWCSYIAIGVIFDAFHDNSVLRSN